MSYIDLDITQEIIDAATLHRDTKDDSELGRYKASHHCVTARAMTAALGRQAIMSIGYWYFEDRKPTDPTYKMPQRVLDIQNTFDYGFHPIKPTTMRIRMVEEK